MTTSHQEPFNCPECYALVPPGALCCPECGSDHETGWSETPRHDLPEPFNPLDIETPDEGPKPRPFAFIALILFIAVLLSYALSY